MRWLKLIGRRRWIIYLGAILLLAVNLLALGEATQSHRSANPLVVETSPDVTFFDQLPPIVPAKSTTVEHLFRLQNLTPKLVEIAELLPACGCTNAVLDQNTLRANETTNLTVTFRPYYRWGHQRFDLSLRHRSGSSWKYRLSTTILPAFEAAKNSINLGQLDENSPNEIPLHFPITLRAAVDDELPKILGVVSPHKGIVSSFECEQSECALDQGIRSATHTILLSFLVPSLLRSGELHTHVILRYKYLDVEDELIVPVYWGVAPLYSLAPQRLVLLKKDANIVDSLIPGSSIRLMSPDAVSIESVVVSDQAVRVTLCDTAGTGPTQFNVSIDSSLVRKFPYFAEVFVHLRESSGKPLRLPIVVY